MNLLFINLFTDNINIFLILVTSIISFIAFSNEKILHQSLHIPYEVNHRKQWWRMVTSGFIHADGMHLFFNMISLYFLGGIVVTYFNNLFGSLGPWLYLLMYISAIIASDVPSYLKHKNNRSYSSLGASGAVSAVVFCFIWLDPWTMLTINFIPMPAILYGVLYMAISYYLSQREGDNINHSAHMWGAAYGILFLCVFQPSTLFRFIAKLINPSF